MAISNVIAFFIILDTAASLHLHGVTDIQTSAQAAESLRPLAGELMLPALQHRNYRHGIVRRSGSGRLGRLRSGGSAQMAHRT